VPGPVHTVGHQLQGGRVNQMDIRLKRKANRPPPATKARTEILQVLQRLPKQFFSHDGVTLPIGMGESIAFGRSSPRIAERGRVQRQSVTSVVEAQTMGQLREEQREHMTPGGKSSRVILHASLAGQLRNQMIGMKLQI